jgi:serine/threonine-protein kinase
MAVPVMTDAPGELEPGSILADRYRVEKLLGRGGMGAVYEATHVQLGRVIALKVLRRDVSSDPDTVRRFMQEAQIAAAIGHPGIVDVFDLGVAPSGAYLAMEKLVGIELGDRIQPGQPLHEREAVAIAIDIASALEAAHEHGVVHRDLKPQNIFLAQPKGAAHRVVKILDFGIAKLTRGDAAGFTQTGAMFGTPLYMSPEQLRGAKDIDARADVYALGCILYEMLTACHPFDADSLPELVLRIVTERPIAVRARSPGVSAELERLVQHAMAPRREERCKSMTELRAALLTHQAHLEANAPPGSPPARPSVELSAAAGLGAQRAESMGTDRTLAVTPMTPTRMSASLPGAGASPSPGSTSLGSPSPGITPPAATPHSLTPHSTTSMAPPLPPPTDARKMGVGLAVVAVVALGVTYVVGNAWAPGERDERDEAEPAARTIAAATEPAAAPPPAARSVAFTSEPRGAQIVVGDESCTAPCVLDVHEHETELVARFPDRPELREALTWPPSAAIHVTMPPAEAAPVVDSRGARAGSGAGSSRRRPVGPAALPDPPPALLPR